MDSIAVDSQITVISAENSELSPPLFSSSSFLCSGVLQTQILTSDNPELRQVRSFKHGVDQNISLHALHTPVIRPH